ncbi:MAG TPA: CvpA family protein [bacterium]|nr:CvpA family protein [bacterium]
MTWIDWLFIAIVMFAALHGMRRGVLAAFIGAVGILAAYLLASIWHVSLATVLIDGVHIGPAWAGTIAYAALLLTGYVFIGTASAVLLEHRLVSAADRLLGGLAGAVKGGLLCAALLGVLLASPLADPVARDTRRSLLAPYALRVQRDGARSLAKFLPPHIHLVGLDDSRF